MPLNTRRSVMPDPKAQIEPKSSKELLGAGKYPSLSGWSEVLSCLEVLALLWDRWASRGRRLLHLIDRKAELRQEGWSKKILVFLSST